MTRRRKPFKLFIKPFVKQNVAMVLLMASLCCLGASALFSVSSNGATLIIATTVPNHTYPTAGIKITSAGYSLTNPGSDCTPAANGYCLFSVSNTSPHNIAISGASGSVNYTLCLNGTSALSCQNMRTTISSGPSIAYVVNSNSTTPVYRCPLDDAGMLTSCSVTGNGFNGAYGIALNTARNMAYISNAYGNSVSRCPIKDDNSFDTCNATASDFFYPQGITLNTANTKLYVSNNSTDTVAICPINSQDGNLTTCAVSGALFSGPVGIALNTTDSRAYVVNSLNNSVSVCILDPQDGTFLSCQNAYTAGVAFSNPQFISLNAANTQAYVTNFGSSSVSICPINPADGTFGTCITAVNTGSDFTVPVGMALSSTDANAYITNYSGNNVYRCPITGSSLACEDASIDAGLSFNNPVGIALK